MQDPNDPRIQEVYRQQRLAAEKQALTTGEASPELAKIASKLQHSGSAQQHEVGNVDATLARGSAKEAGQTGYVPGLTPKLGMRDTDVAMLGAGGAEGLAGKTLEHLASHPTVLEHVAQGVGPMIAKAAKNLLRGVFPEAGDDAGMTATKTAAQKGARTALSKTAKTATKAATKATVKAGVKKTAQAADDAAPKPDYKKGSMRTAAQGAAKRASAKVKLAKAAHGSSSREPIALKGSEPAKGKAPRSARKTASPRTTKKAATQKDTLRQQAEKLGFKPKKTKASKPSDEE